MSKKNEKSVEELLKEALVPEEEQPYKVPENWVYFYFTSLLDINGGTQPPKSEFIDEPKKGYVRLVQIRDFSTDKYTTYIPIKKNLRLIDQDDIVIARYGASLGRILTGLSGAINVALAKLSFSKKLFDRKFLYYLLQTQHFQAPLMKLSRSAQNGFNKNDLSYFPMPLPPLNEQKRIAEKVERLLDKIKQAKQLIEEAKETFELRRAAILDKAFRGELTKKWREEKQNNGSADALLQKIEVLRKKNKLKNVNVSNESISATFYLPNGWKWIKLEELIELSSYGTSAKTDDDDSGVPVLRMGNIIDGQLILDNLKYLPTDHKDVDKYKLEEYDLLFNRTNSYELVGKTAVVHGEKARVMTYASYLVNVRLYLKEKLAKYICYYINSHLGRNYLLSMVTQQVGQANINASKLASLIVPLPPEEEIVEITKTIDYFIENERSLLNSLQLEGELERLTEAILNSAFRGNLDTNVETEESPITLLEQLLISGQ
jgi:type I restriction enzyme S subunit